MGQTRRVGRVDIIVVIVASRFRSGVIKFFKRGRRAVRVRALKAMCISIKAILGFKAIKGSVYLIIIVKGGVIKRVVY